MQEVRRYPNRRRASVVRYPNARLPSERAKADGIPPYVICNNRQLAEVVRVRPDTLTALGAIEGFGEAKLKRYGKALLALVAGAPAGQPDPPEEAGDG